MSTKHGLRERKKIKTRESIRREAYRLFVSQGYANTTVEQIAGAAEVSPSTFFRYFQSKDAVLLSDDLTEPIIDEFRAAPAELRPAAAYQFAITKVFGSLSETEWTYTIGRQQMLYTLPDARSALYAEWTRATRLLTTAIAERVGVPEDNAAVLVTAGAIMGLLQAILNDAPMDGTALVTGLEILDRGALFATDATL